MNRALYMPKRRIEEKQRSRKADERAVASGARSAEQLRRDNGRFAFPHVRVNFSGANAVV
jgi:hypothetical protein